MEHAEFQLHLPSGWAAGVCLASYCSTINEILVLEMSVSGLKLYRIDKEDHFVSELEILMSCKKTLTICGLCVYFLHINLNFQKKNYFHLISNWHISN